jgi:MoCo/4Fe-4S cofactor protein with predicted Tat translocation signal
MAATPQELEKMRLRLMGKQGRQYWRSLDELAQSPEFDELIHREFPREASVLGVVGRRNFLKVMGASLALAGLSGCGSEAPKHIAPYVIGPEHAASGQSQVFTSALTLGGYANGVLVSTSMGRPVKIEGNPNHPASLGATDVFSQAAILSLYDPERSQSVLERTAASTWSRFLGALQGILAEQRALKGAGLRILTETISSPTLARELRKVLEQFPSAKWHQYEPINRDNARAGAQLAYGDDVQAIYHLDKADVIVSLDSDLLFAEPARLPLIRAYSSRRRVRDGQTAMNRHYVFESALTTTGSMADHRWPVRSGEIEALAREIANGLGVRNLPAQIAHASRVPDLPENVIAAIVKDLQQHRGSSVVMAGEHQPPVVHALAMAINETLGNNDKTVTYIAPVEENPVSQAESLHELTADLNAGKVQTLLVLGGNPVYTAPADLEFDRAYQKATVRIHLGLYENATSALSQWHIPQAHELETWGDARAFDGTATVMQPLILPLYNGRSMLEVVAQFAGDSSSSDYELVREHWRDALKSAPDFEAEWRKALSTGVVPETQREAKRNLTLKENLPAADGPAATGLEINFRPDPSVWDGRYINNAWLQELPKPLTKLTWDNAALIAPATAAKLGVADEDVVEISADSRSVHAPILILPGHAADSITLHLGYGQAHGTRVGKDTGFNAYALRTSKAASIGTGASVRKLGKTYPLASTQKHFSMEGRDFIAETTLDDYRREPDFLQKRRETPAPGESLYPQRKYEGYAWGMVIDETACVGCNACVVACQSENNIPVVGKEEVLNSREMHWIRIDRYYSGDLNNPDASFQPLPCMHCENAPCEPVCPVHATTHSAEGLNEMTYNRCIGTRYCSNNCPYKVRRFNFLQYTEMENPAARLRSNPDVTVRERGVMEKCTYCVQRITHARIDSEKENRRIRDHEVTPACAQSCPSDAIIFGDINTPDSSVARLKATPLNYGLLEELNTRPRTTYLARVRNPNPELASVETTPARKQAF